MALVQTSQIVVTSLSQQYDKYSLNVSGTFPANIRQLRRVQLLRRHFWTRSESSANPLINPDYSQLSNNIALFLLSTL